MTRPMDRAAAGIAALAALAACATPPKEAPAGPYSAGGLSVTLERAWTEMPVRLSATPAPYLTYDGPRLNQVHLLSIADGEGVLKPPRTEERTIPVFRAGMSSLQLVELITESVTSFGLQNVTAVEIRPATLAGAEGVGFDLTAAQPNGLRMRGRAVAAETDGTLDLMLYIAPEMHYYEANRAEVERMLASAARR